MKKTQKKAENPNLPALVLDKHEYLRIRKAVTATPVGHDRFEWARSLRRPDNADDLALTLVQVVLASGYSADRAEAAFPNVKRALHAGKSVALAFPHPHKAAAIEQLWRNRERLFADFQAFRGGDPEAVAWFGHLPVAYIRGPVLRYQAARDTAAADVAKPDRLMTRIAKLAGESDVQAMCRRLAKASGDRVGTVDVVLWHAASVGIIPGISRRASGRMARNCA